MRPRFCGTALSRMSGREPNDANVSLAVQVRVILKKTAKSSIMSLGTPNSNVVVAEAISPFK